MDSEAGKCFLTLYCTFRDLRNDKERNFYGYALGSDLIVSTGADVEIIWTDSAGNNSEHEIVVVKKMAAHEIGKFWVQISEEAPVSHSTSVVS